MSRLAITLLFALLSHHAAAQRIYDPAADARRDIATAQEQIQPETQAVLVVFGADWCGDCRILDAALRGGSVADLVRKRLRIVKVDVGRFDRNADLAASLGIDLRRGIPAAAILSARGDVLHATQAGELARARSLGDAGIRDYFASILNKTE
jgi:thioredoxin 1